MKNAPLSRYLPSFLRQSLQDFAGQPLAIACSGGVDSLVLAHALKCASDLNPQQFPQLALFHVDHGQHPQSAAICQWVHQWGHALGLPVLSTRLDLPCKASEATLRRERYSAFESMWAQWQSSAPNSKVTLLLAHHAQDQLETMLFRLLRGTHPSTLRGMSARSHRGALQLVRPLLNYSKQDLIAYAEHHSLEWKEDPTNNDTTYARNALRHKLLPLLEELRPRSSEKLLQFFKDLKEWQHPANTSADFVSQTESPPPGGVPEGAIDIRTVSSSQILIWTQQLLAADNQKVKRIHWENLRKALESGITNGEKRILQFPGGLQIVIHQRKLRFLPGKT